MSEIIFARFIRRYIVDPDCAVLLQDLEARLTYPFVEAIAQRYLAIQHDAELYWRVSGDKLAEGSDEDMAEVLSLSGRFPFTAFLYVNGISHEESNLVEADFIHVVKNLVAVVVSVFDYDSL